MLHTLISSPWFINIDMLIAMISKEDDLILLQDGVIASIEGNNIQKKLLLISSKTWVLQEDVQARGLSKLISPKFNKIDYNGFLQLTIKHNQQISW